MQAGLRTPSPPPDQTTDTPPPPLFASISHHVPIRLQVGALAGSTLATRATYLSLPHLYTLGGLTPAFMALLVRKYTRKFGDILPPEALHKGACVRVCVYVCVCV
jgi:hypothetical protein